MNRTFVTALLAMALIIAAGCDDENTSPTAQPGTVTLELAHTVDGVALALDAIQYTNAVGQRYSVETLKYYLSHIMLRSATTAHQLADLHYVDVRVPATLSMTVTDVPADTYTSLSLVYGLNEGDNMTDALPPTQENINMAWPEPMGGGYHYMKLEGQFEALPDTLGYTTHTGRNGPVDTGTPHFIEFTLDLATPLAIDGNAATLTLTQELNEWYTNPTDFTLGNGSIMGNVVLQDLLEANGADVYGDVAVSSN